VGLSNSKTSTWTNVYLQFCDRTNVRLYCFEQCTTTSDATAGAATTGDKTIFATKAMYSGNLGGLLGADAKCQVAANAAGLTGTYKAWLSDSKTTAATRLSRTTGSYKLKSGKLVAAGFTALTSGTLAGSINEDETGTVFPSAAEVWTGTNANGSGTGGCTDWTATSGTTPSVGLTSSTTSSWTNTYLQFCDRTNVRLYCLEQ
jgi:hypothetical protein